MRIALCFSGQPRFINECYNDISNFFELDKYGQGGSERTNDKLVDTYAHLWWDDSYKGKIIRIHSKHRYDNETDNGQLFIDKYKPVDYIIEPQRDFPLDWYNDDAVSCLKSSGKLIDKTLTPKNLFCQMSQYYSVAKSIEVCKNHNVDHPYDYVIRLRTDMITVDKSITFRDTVQFKNEIYYNKLLLASTMEGGALYCGHVQYTPSDWFFAGKIDLVSKFASHLYNDYRDVMKDGLKHIYEYIVIIIKRSGMKNKSCQYYSNVTLYRKDMDKSLDGGKLHHSNDDYYKYHELAEKKQFDQLEKVENDVAYFSNKIYDTRRRETQHPQHPTQQHPQQQQPSNLNLLAKKHDLKTIFNNYSDLIKQYYNDQHSFNNDAIWKWSYILYCVDLLKLKPNIVLDIGSGTSCIGLILKDYLKSTYQHDSLIHLNTLLPKYNDLCVGVDGIELKQGDFFKYDFGSTKYDLIYDSCALTHFDSRSRESFNDGLMRAGKIIYNLLNDDGYFIITSDINFNSTHGEFINPTNMIKIFNSIGFKLVNNDLTNINNHDKTSLFDIIFSDKTLNIIGLIFSK